MNLRYLYTQTHEYMTVGGRFSQIGISNYAQKELGDIVFVNLPTAGQTITKGEPFCEIESVKAVATVNAPCNGIIKKVNLMLDEKPELLNEDPKKNWIVEIEITGEYSDLMSEEKYLKYIGK
ncbi:MAG: glycine cleavage system protein GcvH [Clostridiales bacterium]|nr:glycine cleavage system protein GcvH [Clostridiales bacterium]